jgi:hypothetical protein
MHIEGFHFRGFAADLRQGRSFNSECENVIHFALRRRELFFCIGRKTARPPIS